MGDTLQGRTVALLALLAVTFWQPWDQAQAASAAATSEDAPAKVLYIGNSYTYYHRMPGIISAMARAEGSPRQIHNKAVAVPAATLQMHWESGAAQRVIQERKWDYVVLQEQSLLPLEDRERMFKYVRLFDKEIKLNGAKTVLFLTWARRDRPEMQAELNAAYGDIGKELEATVAPVGPAWQLAQRGAADLQLYEKDGSHPTLIGAYLTACVLYLVMQNSESQCPVLDEGAISSSTGAALRAAAAGALGRPAQKSGSAGGMLPNPSIERTASGGLRPPASAAHVER
jgi:hypothetical protein